MFAHILCGLWRCRRGLFVLCLLVFCYGVFRPEPPPDLFQDSDKFLHVLAFAGLSWSAGLAFDRAPAWLVWPVLAAMAPLVEWLQHVAQPMREFSPGDIQANFAGVALGYVAWLAIKRLLAVQQA